MDDPLRNGIPEAEEHDVANANVMSEEDSESPLYPPELHQVVLPSLSQQVMLILKIWILQARLRYGAKYYMDILKPFPGRETSVNAPAVGKGLPPFNCFEPVITKWKAFFHPLFS